MKSKRGLEAGARVWMGICASTVLALALLVGGASVALACYEPSAPYCASRYGAFSDEWEFTSCKREMESYQSDVEAYVSYNNDEAQEAIDRARRANQTAADAYSGAVDDFNRRVRQ